MKIDLRHLSLRSYLMLGILLPVALFILVDSVVLYRQALAAVNTAYDRTLLASAKTIGEHIQADGKAEAATLHTVVPGPVAWPVARAGALCRIGRFL
jgi:two-component system sensor histidine kinase TctE